MFVITADQVDSRHDVDRADAAVRSLETAFGDDLVLPVDQTAGDEIQAVTPSASTALGDGRSTRPLRTLEHRAGHRFGAHSAARRRTQGHRAGVHRSAGRRRGGQTHRVRFALRAPDAVERAAIIEPLVGMLLLTRARRSEQGWEVGDLMRAGHSQKDAAGILGISAAAVSQRLRAALWRVEDDARSSLEHLLAELDAEASPATRNGTDPTE